MKILTVKQPYAGLLAAGIKQYETRSWKTNYRGEVAIHSSQRPASPDVFALVKQALIRRNMWEPRLEDLLQIRGHVLSVHELKVTTPVPKIQHATDLERMLGFWEDKNHAWAMPLICSLDPPIKALGTLGLWTPPVDLEHQLETYLFDRVA